MIRQRGIAQFLLSSTEHNALTRMLGKFRLQETFDGVQGMMNTLALGELEGGMLLLDSYGIERRRTVFIGDTTHDADVARTLGVSCILLSTGHQSRDRLEAVRCPVIDSYDELLKALA